MDIRSAAIYLKHGYRIRRSIWEPEDHLKEGILGPCRVLVRYETRIRIENGTLVTELNARTVLENEMYPLEVEDLAADDWEIITTNIRTHFGQGGKIEYDDEDE